MLVKILNLSVNLTSLPVHSNANPRTPPASSGPEFFALKITTNTLTSYREVILLQPGLPQFENLRHLRGAVGLREKGCLRQPVALDEDLQTPLGVPQHEENYKRDVHPRGLNRLQPEFLQLRLHAQARVNQQQPAEIVRVLEALDRQFYVPVQEGQIPHLLVFILAFLDVRNLKRVLNVPQRDRELKFVVQVWGYK